MLDVHSQKHWLYLDRAETTVRPDYLGAAVVFARAIIWQIGFCDKVRSGELLRANINSNSHFWRWVARLEPADDLELRGYQQNLCLVGFCAKEEFDDIGEAFGKSDQTFLALPIFYRTTHHDSPQSNASGWGHELAKSLTVF